MAAMLISAQAVDFDGNVLSGAKLNVYDAGTTTPRAIYVSSALSGGASSANPAIATSAGGVAVWVDDTAGDIWVTLTNSAGTTFYYNQNNIDPTNGNLVIFPLGGSDQTTGTGDSVTFANLTIGAVPFSGVTADPGADRIMFWDDSDTQVEWLSLGTGLSITANTLSLDGDLEDISGLTPADGAVIIGDGTDFTTESGATLRTSLGLAIGSDVLAYDANLQAFVGVFTLPTTDGTAGQYLKTDGAGALAFATPAGGGDTLAAANETISGDWEFTGSPDFSGVGNVNTIRSDLSVPLIYSTCSALASQAVSAFTNGQQFIVTGYSAANDGGGGVFYYTTSDISDGVDQDGLNGVFIPDPADATGASGGYVRLIEHTTVEMFGGKGDWTASSATDNRDALEAALNVAAVYTAVRNGVSSVTTTTNQQGNLETKLLGGLYHIDTDGGSIVIPEGATLSGQGGNQSRFIEVSGQGTTLMITGTTNAPFEHIKSANLTNFGVFYPDQRNAAVYNSSAAPGAAGAPTVYPFFLSRGSNAGNRCRIHNVYLYNAYKGFEVGAGAELIAVNGFCYLSYVKIFNANAAPKIADCFFSGANLRYLDSDDFSGTSVTIASVADSGGDALFTTSGEHKYSVGESITISDTTNYDGTATVATVPSTTTLTLTGISYVADETGEIEPEFQVSGRGVNWSHIHSTVLEVEGVADGLIFSNSLIFSAKTLLKISNGTDSAVTQTNQNFQRFSNLVVDGLRKIIEFDESGSQGKIGVFEQQWNNCFFGMDYGNDPDSSVLAADETAIDFNFTGYRGLASGIAVNVALGTDGTITSVTDSSGTALFNTAGAHGYSVSDSVQVWNTTNYNVTATVATVPTTTSFTLTAISYVANDTGWSTSDTQTDADQSVRFENCKMRKLIGNGIKIANGCTLNRFTWIGGEMIGLDLYGTSTTSPAYFVKTNSATTDVTIQDVAVKAEFGVNQPIDDAKLFLFSKARRLRVASMDIDGTADAANTTTCISLGTVTEAIIESNTAHDGDVGFEITGTVTDLFVRNNVLTDAGTADYQSSGTVTNLYKYDNSIDTDSTAIGFKATMASSQSRTGGSAAVVMTYDTESYDYGADYSATNKRFTAPQDGIYRYLMRAEWTDSGGDASYTMDFSLQINNDTQQMYAMPSGTGATDSITLTGEVYLQSGETMRWTVENQSSGGTATISNTAADTFWQMDLLPTRPGGLL